MSALKPRKPYNDEELRQLYPPGLELQLVQILMRHGERTPVSGRFQNAGLSPFWPYCASVRQLRSAVLEDAGGAVSGAVSGAGETAPFSTLEWKRRLETFGSNDEPIIATGPRGQLDNVCDMGTLTDVGRQSTYRLGIRLRELYVDRLKFLPPQIESTDFMYLRSTPIVRALESLQQTFSALYPPSTRIPGQDGTFPAPTILTRTQGDETLFPNDTNCRRFAALARVFAQRTAERWNKTEEMEYLDKLYGKWMPEDSPRVKVDSKPRLTGIMDTINSTLAHGPETRLPKEFYDEKGLKIIEKINVEEWYSGYKESREYRMLGIGGLLGDIVGRMVGSAERTAADGRYEIMSKSKASQAPITFGLSGCHDVTLAAVLASLGSLDDNEWPPFTSHIAIEMFRNSAAAAPVPTKGTATKWNWFGGIGSSFTAGQPPQGIGRKRTPELTAAEAKRLEGYYVRLRYNDRPITIPGCKLPGNHLEGDESFCTLVRN